MFKSLPVVAELMEAVLFDLGHTLIDYYCDWRGPEQRGVERIYQLVSETSPAPVDRSEFTAYLTERLVRARERKKEDMVEVPLTELLGGCLERYGCLDEVTLQEGLEIFYGVLLRSASWCRSGGAAGRLSDRGLVIGLSPTWRSACRRSSRRGRSTSAWTSTSTTWSSTDVGLRKPHPGVQDRPVQPWRVGIRRDVHGNSLFHDIKGAKVSA